ncbi:hypothetical protein OHD50_26565 [Escherichia coli]|nr:hypothetical protein [Escherichia coli]
MILVASEQSHPPSCLSLPATAALVKACGTGCPLKIEVSAILAEAAIYINTTIDDKSIRFISGSVFLHQYYF